MTYEIEQGQDGLIRIYHRGPFERLLVGVLSPAAWARLQAAARAERPPEPPTSPDRRLWCPGHYAALLEDLRIEYGTAQARAVGSRYSEDERRALLSAWAAWPRDRSLDEFCRAHDLAPATLRRWLRGTARQLRLVAI